MKRQLRATAARRRKARRSSQSELTDVVVLQYDDLVADRDLTASIKAAFGPDGLGILAVQGVPEVARQRQALLPLAPRFASMPHDVKAKYEHPESFWSFGWSHGKEKLQGRPDFAKGSYYNNPMENTPFTDEATIKEYPSFAHPNIWPTEHLPELEPAFMELGQTIVRVGKLVAKQCDRYIEAKSPAYAKGKLSRVLDASRVTKARLLHYFPPAAAAETRCRLRGVWRKTRSPPQDSAEDPALSRDLRAQGMRLLRKALMGVLRPTTLPPNHLGPRLNIMTTMSFPRGVAGTTTMAP